MVLGTADVLVAHELQKTFKKVHAVRGISISVAPGERLGLLGPNGAGKTTTLRMVLGAILPDAGTVTIVGHRLPRHRSKAMERVGFAAGYLPYTDNGGRYPAMEYPVLIGYFAYGAAWVTQTLSGSPDLRERALVNGDRIYVEPGVAAESERYFVVSAVLLAPFALLAAWVLTGVHRLARLSAGGHRLVRRRLRCPRAVRRAGGQRLVAALSARPTA